ncbi:hypothetical protein Tco_1319079 [Tanacetum coccineum]
MSIRHKTNNDQSGRGKLRNLNPEESWAILEDLAFYDNKSWNDPKDFAKSVKEITLPQDVSSTSDRRLIELKNQVQCLMEAHLAPTQPTQVNKITTPCEICSGPHDTHCCMKNPEQAFVEYASSRSDEAGGRGFLATANAVIDCRMAKIAVREGITRLYLMRRSLEVLRKFHWMILGGRFNQLSHISSPLLSKPGEYKAHLLEDKQISSVGVFDEVGFKRISLKGFAAALAVLLPERLKADNTISLAVDSISALLLFGDWRLEQTATFSISTIFE